MDDATRDRPNRRDARTGARLPYDGDGSISDPSDAVRKVQRRSLFHETWFDSDGERRFAVLLEDEPDQAIKWFRPGPRDIHLYWNADQQYEPDFIVETAQQKLMIEVKSADEIEDSDVQKKARALSTGARTRAHTRILSAVSGGSTCSCPIPRSGQPRRLTR